MAVCFLKDNMESLLSFHGIAWDAIYGVSDQRK